MESTKRECKEDNEENKKNTNINFSELNNYYIKCSDKLKSKELTLDLNNAIKLNEYENEIEKNEEMINEINDKLKDEENDKIQNEINNKLKDEINDNLKNGVNEKIKDEMNYKIKDKLKDKMKEEDKEKNIYDEYKKLPTIIIVIGMAGSGKTTYVGSLYKYLKKNNKKIYTVNLDPAVKYIHYNANIDIRDSIKYKNIMKEYKLGPNGGIMTCLNLFATRFDKVIELFEKRKHLLDYIIIDTPGQIEVFNWSASGNIILESLSCSFPVIINYIVDTVRCERPITFMSNMLYACSVLYKCRLPFLACFNKIDIVKHDKCIEWMTNFDTFNEDVLKDESYMASFSRSCGLMINEFYEEIKTIGVSSKTHEGFNNIIKKFELLKEEYLNEYLPRIEKQLKRIKKKKEKNIEMKMESFLMEHQQNTV